VRVQPLSTGRLRHRLGLTRAAPDAERLRESDRCGPYDQRTMQWTNAVKCDSPFPATA
jgi:hypothetical protein